MAQKLFDKASLVMIPSQYKEGKIYNIKPEDQSSSFEFERGSAATRVNEDGLIEYVGVGEELVTDGGFDDASAWSTSGGASVSGGKLILDAQNEVAQQLNLGIVSGKEYKVDFTIEGENAHLIVYLGSYSSSNAGSVYTIQSEGAYSIRLDAHTDGDFIKFNCPSSGKNFTVDNVSVRLIENDTPRIDYTNGKALLLEPQRTNYITHSNAFDLWAIVGSPTITNNYGTSPEGVQNSTRFQTTSDRVSTDVGSISVGDTFSFYAKGSGTLFIQLGGNNNFFQVLTNEWVRYEFTIALAGGNTNVQIRGNNSVVDAELYGAQYEQDSYATSYIPTNGQAETRLADLCTDGGNESTFNDSEGVLYAELLKPAESNSAFTLISINNADGNSDSNTVTLGFNSSDKFYFRVRANSANALLEQTTSASHNQYHKLALKYKSGDLAAWVNGVEEATSSNNTFSFATTLDNLSFDYNGNGGLPFYGGLRALYYFPEALTDTELQQLTSNT